MYIQYCMKIEVVGAKTSQAEGKAMVVVGGDDGWGTQPFPLSFALESSDWKSCAYRHW